MSDALFYSFDGIDGTGKSTQVALLAKWLDAAGRPAIVCRDPGTTALGERLRQLVLDSDESTPIGARAEMLLYMAARAQLVEEVIRPALDSGQTVISDRYLLANVVYQGYAGGIDLEAVRAVGGVAIDGVLPHCTFLLDMDPSKARARMGVQLDRVERRGDEYRRRLRDGFLAEAAAMGPSVHVIDAARDIDAVHSEIRSIAEAALLNC